LNKREILIKIREEEEKAIKVISDAQKEKERLIDSAKVEAHSMREAATREAQVHYNRAIEEYNAKNTEEEKALIEKEEKDLHDMIEKGKRNIDKATAVVFEEFVRYIDVKAEENE